MPLMRDVMVGFFAFKRASPLVASAADGASPPFAAEWRGAGGASGALCSEEAVEAEAEATGEAWGFATTPWGLEV